jgi:tryptophanyl-tRNA synthetase
MIKRFYGYSKMSKSFPDSGISVDMGPSTIRERIINGEGEYDKPENNVVYQMMASVSYLNVDELKENYKACLEGGKKWERAKRDYVEMLVDICSRWKK